MATLEEATARVNALGAQMAEAYEAVALAKARISTLRDAYEAAQDDLYKLRRASCDAVIDKLAAGAPQEGGR